MAAAKASRGAGLSNVQCAIIALAFSVAFFGAPLPSLAGIFCGDRVTGGAASGPNKEEASQAAVSWWSSRAGALGPGYENWDAATEKRILCTESENGKFACTASAKPCLPEGQIPETGKRLEL